MAMIIYISYLFKPKQIKIADFFPLPFSSLLYTVPWVSFEKQQSPLHHWKHCAPDGQEYNVNGRSRQTFPKEDTGWEGVMMKNPRKPAPAPIVYMRLYIFAQLNTLHPSTLTTAVNLMTLFKLFQWRNENHCIQHTVLHCGSQVAHSSSIIMWATRIIT